MNRLDEDLALALVRERTARLRFLQPVRDAVRTRRPAPAGARPGWWRRLLTPLPVAPLPVTPLPVAAYDHPAPSTPARPGTPGLLETLLDAAAVEVAANGTCASARTLTAMSVATRRLCPGAAAALVDWAGSEPARLRAFGLVHGTVLNALDEPGRRWLLAQLADPPIAVPVQRAPLDPAAPAAEPLAGSRTRCDEAA